MILSIKSIHEEMLKTENAWPATLLVQDKHGGFSGKSALLSNRFEREGGGAFDR